MGGYLCEFVKRPPKAIQSECLVCLQVLREPYQAPCCGNSFCKGCIERIKTDNKRCPTCNKESFEIFHNKGLQRSLYGFQVYCSHKQEGCEWKGELGQLDNHLNLSPQPDKQLEGCEYSEIECIYCSELIKRPNIASHQTEHCDKRPFSCEYCHSYESTYEDVINNHWLVCGYHPVRCPNECGTFPQRQALENHVTKECPKTVIDCDFHHVGCNVKLPRKDMPAHLNENLVTHMSLQATHQGGMLATLQHKVNNLEKENKSLIYNNQRMEQQVSLLKATSEVGANSVHQIAKHVGLPSSPDDCVEFTMTNYHRRKTRGTEWYSPPFYTHPGGYKLCMCVDADGCDDGEGTHLSVNVHLMRGEFDVNLKWPFRGEVMVQLVIEGQKPYGYTVHFNDNVPRGSANRVLGRYRSDNGCGHPCLISSEDLEAYYLDGDELHFRVKCKSVHA